MRDETPFSSVLLIEFAIGNELSPNLLNIVESTMNLLSQTLVPLIYGAQFFALLSFKDAIITKPTERADKARR